MFVLIVVLIILKKMFFLKSKDFTINELRTAFNRQKQLEEGCDYAVGIYRGGVIL